MSGAAELAHPNGGVTIPKEWDLFLLQELPQPLLSEHRCHLPSPSQSWDHSGDLSLVKAHVPPWCMLCAHQGLWAMTPPTASPLPFAFRT